MTIFMDTVRSNRNIIQMVECKANIVICDQDVQLSVIAFGEGREGTDKAFERMEEVIDELGYGYMERVRVY